MYQQSGVDGTKHFMFSTWVSLVLASTISSQYANADLLKLRAAFVSASITAIGNFGDKTLFFFHSIGSWFIVSLMVTVAVEERAAMIY